MWPVVCLFCCVFIWCYFKFLVDEVLGKSVAFWMHICCSCEVVTAVWLRVALRLWLALQFLDVSIINAWWSTAYFFVHHAQISFRSNESDGIGFHLGTRSEALLAVCIGLMWFVDKAQWDVNGKSVHQIMDTFHVNKKTGEKDFQAIALFLSLIFLSVAANWALLKMGQVSPAVRSSIRF